MGTPNDKEEILLHEIESFKPAKWSKSELVELLECAKKNNQKELFEIFNTFDEVMRVN